MDKKTLLERREHEVGFYKSQLVDPGPLDPEETRSWSERYFAMAAAIQPYLGGPIPPGSIDAHRTPKVEIMPATDELPAVTLYLAYGNSLDNCIAARWEYSEQPEGRSNKTRNEEFKLEFEQFSEECVRLSPDAHPITGTSLNRLEHSVAAYIEAVGDIAGR